MLRIAFCVCVALIFSACQKNWRGLVVEKRIYRDGYYIHIPWKRATPQQAYPKPEPYPVDHSHTAATDSTQKNAGGVVSTSNQSQSAVADNNRSSGTGGGQSPSGAGGNGVSDTGSSGGGNGGGGNPSNSPAVGPDSPQQTNGTTAYPQTASHSPAPPLQTVPEQPTPPLVRPSNVTAVPPADSSIAAKNPAPVDSSNKIEFPEGELSLVAELGFYNPLYISGIEIKPLSFNAGCAFRYTIHPWARHKISGEGGLYASGIFIEQDQHKYNPLFETRHDKERILQFKWRFVFMDHIYFSRKENALFDAVEVGLFSDIGLFSTHVVVDYYGNNESAMLTRSKTRLFGLHYLRTMQCGLTARIANDVWSVFANYRLNSLVKAGPDGGDLPTLVVGATFVLTQ